MAQHLRTFTKSLNGGVLTPEFFGMIDSPKYHSGAEILKNYIVLPHGPASNRTGTAFVREVKDSAKKVCLLPFTYSTTQTMVLEFGENYTRFHTQGATLLYSTPAAWVTATAYVVGDIRSNGGVNYYCRVAHTSGTFATDLAANRWYALPSNPNIYEIPTSYTEAQLFDIHYVQSADVLTLVHPSHPVRELRRLGATQWTLVDVSFASSLAAPTGVSAVATTGTGSTTYSYKVTAVSSDGKDESLGSSAASCTNNLLTSGNKNTVSWSSVSGATYYNVYKQTNGLYAYIGQTDQTSFVDDNIAGDTKKVIPISVNPFTSTGNYPGAVSYFEQRRVFGGTTNAPQTFWMTKSATESNLNYSIPARADDGISIRIAAREANTIRHIVPLQDLLLLTGSAEWRVSAVNSDAISADSPPAIKPQSYVGCNNAQPLIVNNNVLFAAARGGHMRELAFSSDAGGYLTGDLSMFAPHLFDGMDISQMAYQKAPFPIVWCISTGGRLLGLTYVPEQKVGGWHYHETDGTFESVAVVAEGVEDAVYVVVKRTINGAEKRYVERFAPRLWSTLENAFYVDCGLTYSGAAATTITGLGHLEGKTVSILANGAVMPQQVVTSGQITLERASTLVHIGLPYDCDLKPVPLVTQVDGAMGVGRPANVNRVMLRVYRSSGIFAGPDFNTLSEYKQRTDEPYGQAPDLKSEVIEVVTDASWETGGQVCIRQTYPLPSTIVSISYEVALGG